MANAIVHNSAPAAPRVRVPSNVEDEIEEAVVVHSPRHETLESTIVRGLTSAVIASPAHWADASLLVPHEPIRRDVRALRLALEPAHFNYQMRWKVPMFFKFWFKYHHTFVHHHHDIEEELYFPWIGTRAALPPKLADDHEGLLRLMAAVGDTKQELTDAAAMSERVWEAAAAELRSRFAAYAEAMEAHLQEEEESVPGCLKAHFSEDEEKAAVQKIMQKLSLGTTRRMLPWIIDNMRLWGGEMAAASFCASLPGPLRFMLARAWVPAYERKNRGLLAILFTKRASAASLYLPFKKL